MRRIGNASLQRFAKLSLRQRLALIVMIALLMVALAYVIILLPQQQKRAKYQRDLQESQGAVLQLKARLAALTSARQRGVLRNGGGGEISAAQLAALALFLTTPDASGSELRSLLHILLEDHTELTLLAFRTLPATPFYTPDEKLKALSPGGGKLANPLYKQGVEITIRGHYAQLLDYMQKLQAYPKRIYWAETRLDAGVYPDSILKLQLYFLSDQNEAPLS